MRLCKGAKLSVEMQDDIAEYALYAFRQMGVISAELDKAQGQRNDIELRPDNGQSKTEPLVVAGISKQRANVFLVAGK